MTLCDVRAKMRSSFLKKRHKQSALSDREGEKIQSYQSLPVYTIVRGMFKELHIRQVSCQRKKHIRRRLGVLFRNRQLRRQELGFNGVIVVGCIKDKVNDG